MTDHTPTVTLSEVEDIMDALDTLREAERRISTLSYRSDAPQDQTRAAAAIGAALEAGVRQIEWALITAEVVGKDPNVGVARALRSKMNNEHSVKA